MKLRDFMPLLATAIIVPFMMSCDDDKDINQNKVPQKVLEAFNDLYPGTNPQYINWEKNRGYYVADFREDNRTLDVWFNSDGQWQMTETDYSRDFTALPAEIQGAFNATDFSTMQIDDIDYFSRIGDEFYVIEVDAQNDRDADLFFTVTDGLVKEKWNFDKEILPDTNINNL